MSWFKKLFQKTPIAKIIGYPVENYKCCDKHALTRQRIEDIEYPIQGTMGLGAWANFHTTMRKLTQYKYWCSCGTELTDGPTGGCSVCAVCEKCKINYGADLPGFWGH